MKKYKQSLGKRGGETLRLFVETEFSNKELLTPTTFERDIKSLALWELIQGSMGVAEKTQLSKVLKLPQVELLKLRKQYCEWVLKLTEEYSSTYEKASKKLDHLEKIHMGVMGLTPAEYLKQFEKAALECEITEEAQIRRFRLQSEGALRRELTLRKFDNWLDVRAVVESLDELDGTDKDTTDIT